MREGHRLRVRDKADLEPIAFVKNAYSELSLKRFDAAFVNELGIKSTNTKRFLVDVGVPRFECRLGHFHFVNPLKFELPSLNYQGEIPPAGKSALHVANLGWMEHPVYLDAEGAVFGYFEQQESAASWYISRSLECFVAQIDLISSFGYDESEMTADLLDSIVSVFIGELLTMDPDALKGFWQIDIEELIYNPFKKRS